MRPIQRGCLAGQQVTGDDDHIAIQMQQVFDLATDQSPQNTTFNVVNVLDTLGKIAVGHLMEIGCITPHHRADRIFSRDTRLGYLVA